MNSETRRLNKLKETSHNLAKRYKLPEAAVKIIQKNGKVHGQQSRAIQVAVELLWEKVGWRVPDRAMSAILRFTTHRQDLQAPASNRLVH